MTMKNIIITTTISATLTLVAHGAVTWNVQNVGSNLHIWTTGSVNLANLPNDLTTSTVYENEYIDSVSMIARDDPNTHFSYGLSGMTVGANIVATTFSQDVWSSNGTTEKAFGTWFDTNNNNTGYVYYTAGQASANYTPTVDFTIQNKQVSDIWGTNLDDMVEHQIADLGDGRGVVNVLQIKPVPEPSSVTLLGLSSLAILFRRKRKQ